MGSRPAITRSGDAFKASAIAKLSIERMKNPSLLAGDGMHGGKVVQLNPSIALSRRHHGDGAQMIFGLLVCPVGDGVKSDGHDWLGVAGHLCPCGPMMAQPPAAQHQPATIVHTTDRGGLMAP